MGGIKNKQSNKLSNKTVTKGSRLPSFSQPSEMLTRNISNTRTSNWWSLYASKTIGSLRLVTLTKYLSIACLSLAILSTIGLNIISSYSSSNILSNAEEVATLATGPVVSGPAEIAISIQSLATPTSSPCDTSNSDICMSIPDDGGIATGGHTVSIDSSSVAGWTLSLSNNSDSKLINKDNSNNIDNGTATIDSLPITANLQSPTRLANNTWGIALPYGTNAPYYSDEANYTSSDKDVLANNLYSSIAYFNQSSSYYIAETVNPSTPGVKSRNIYYGVRVDHPEQLLAGNYTTKVVYTATTRPVPKPTITSIMPNSYQLGSGGTNTVTIEGTNLSSAYRVYLVSNTDSSKQYDITNTIINLTNTGLTVTIPTDQTNSELEAGEYTIHVVTQGTDESGVTVGFSYTKKTLPDGVLESTDDYGNDGHVAVDYDENLIPVKFSAGSGWGGSTVTAIPRSEIEADPTVWYDYRDSKKQWANAVTVKNPDTYKNITSETPVNNSDIQGYWVYIPRYAYKVMRRDASDNVVKDATAQSKGGFEIKFETNTDPKKTPVKCNRTGQDYQTCVGTVALNYPTDPSLKDSTAWATHPAFSWGTATTGYEEMNGFWIGKFETTDSSYEYPPGYPGSSNSGPTILPGHAPYGIVSNSWTNVSEMYDTAKSLGNDDPNNNYGGDTVLSNNSHHLRAATSHMVKNNEWGATLYLASSKFGTGIGNIQPNMSYDDDTGSSSPISAPTTACGPQPQSIRDCTITNNGAKSASTTGNEYGVFDMVGGAFEIVMGAYGRNGRPISSSDGFITVPQPPYTQVYSMTSSDGCTWETCGGDATYETENSTMYSPISGGGSSSAPSEFPMWGYGPGTFVDPYAQWMSRSMGSDMILAGVASPMNVNMYGAYSWPSDTIGSEYHNLALRVVLRNSSTDSTSGGDDNPSGDDKPQWNVNVTNVDPSQLHVVQLVTNDPRYFYLSGSGLNKVYRITLTGVQYPEFTQELTCYPESDTHSECNTREWDTNNGNPAQDYRATFYDYSGNVVYEMDVFVTIIGSL